jgi:uncharacterized protein YndB with AHSA1/START domain
MAINSTGSAGREFVIERLFDAPRERVFEAFTQERHLKHWWGPKGLTMVATKLDLRVGGTFHYEMKAPDGQPMRGRWLFREIVAPERLSFVFGFADEQGNPARHPMAPTWPLEMLGTVTFTARGRRTLLVNRVSAINPSDVERQTFEAGFDSMNQGFNGTWDQLAAYLSNI